MPFIEENFRSKVGYWKNTDSGENYFTCMELSQELNHNRQNLGMNPWAMFDYVSLGYNLDHVQKWKSKPLRAELIARADERLQEYKNKKIAYDYSSAYNVKKDIKRIIQIESVNYARQD
jgi:hypothetical protein